MLAPLLSLLLLFSAPYDKNTRIELKTVTSMQGYSCAAGYAWMFPDGKLASCTLSRESKFGEITVPEKSMIYLSGDGDPRFVFLAHTATIHGYACRGGGQDFSTALYPSGALKTCWLATDTLVDGIPCMQAGFFADVFGGGVETQFFENGKLKTCKLSHEVELAGHTFKKGDHVRLDPTGTASGRIRPEVP
jgi:hypothetical protein